MMVIEQKWIDNAVNEQDWSISKQLEKREV